MIEELAQYTSDELLAELQSRHTATVFCGLMNAPVGDKHDVRYHVYAGGIETCIGLCRSTEHKLLKLIDDSTVVDSDEN